ncbi:MAG: SDR family oxidoreductase [Hyphomicrobiaceae bacterium]
MPKSSKDKLVLVTGGGRGIGEEVVRALASAGYDVTFTYRSAVSQADALSNALRDQYPTQKFTSLRADLAAKEEVEALAARLSEWPELYGFVHNAGASYDALAAMIDQARAEELMQINFWSMTRLIKAAVRPMMRAKSGRIVAIGSITAHQGTQGNATYAATKGALASYMKTLAVEVARKGITANVVAPGYVDTEMLAAYGANRQAVEKQIPVGRFARADEIASFVSYLVGPEAACISGVEITIDGGLSASIGIRN